MDHWGLLPCKALRNGLVAIYGKLLGQGQNDGLGEAGFEQPAWPMELSDATPVVLLTLLTKQYMDILGRRQPKQGADD